MFILFFYFVLYCYNVSNMSEIVTAHQIREMLAENIDGISRVEMSTMGMEVLPRLMEMLSLQGDCQICRGYFDGLMVYARDVRLIFKGSKQEQLNFQKLANEAMSHLKMVHGIRPRGELRALYLFGGSVMGLMVGCLTALFIFPQVNIFQASLLGWFCFVVPAWWLGNRQETRLKQCKKLF